MGSHLQLHLLEHPLQIAQRHGLFGHTPLRGVANALCVRGTVDGSGRVLFGAHALANRLR